jgi:hypothetical protein
VHKQAIMKSDEPIGFSNIIQTPIATNGIVNAKIFKPFNGFL